MLLDIIKNIVEILPVIILCFLILIRSHAIIIKHKYSKPNIYSDKVDLTFWLEDIISILFLGGIFSFITGWIDFDMFGWEIYKRISSFQDIILGGLIGVLIFYCLIYVRLRNDIFSLYDKKLKGKELNEKVSSKFINTIKKFLKLVMILITFFYLRMFLIL